MTFFFTQRFGLTGDVSGTWRRENQTYFNEPYRAQLEIYNFLAGPQVRFVNSTRWTPFVRAMAGVAYSRNRFGARSSTAPFETFDDSSVDFALGLGGGLDYRISDRVSYRILQGDYNPIFRRDANRR
jgi:opacity protein-like surface antigen